MRCCSCSTCSLVLIHLYQSTDRLAEGTSMEPLDASDVSSTVASGHLCGGMVVATSHSCHHETLAQEQLAWWRESAHGSTYKLERS
jgi:hypothetical protein